MTIKTGNPFDPPARQLKPAIKFLRQLDVPAGRIAGALGETADNIRHLDSRVQDDLAITVPISIADRAYQHLTNPQLKASGRKGRLSSSNKNIRRMNALEDDIIRIRQEYGTADLVGGFSALRELTPYLSRVAHPSALRTRATLEENLAWFATHLGLATTAYKHATAAMEYRRKCYDGSFGNRSHLVAYASSGLIASNSLLISYRPRDATSPYRPLEAILILNDVYQAKAAAGEDLGSEWFRQLATALLQHGNHDSLAHKLYDKAGQELEKNSGCDLVTIHMNRERQQDFLDPRAGWERALDLIAETEKKFGELSLEHAMATNWAAAVAFNLDSPSVIREGQELLRRLATLNLPFAHQGTITKLLSITPELKLNAEFRDLWLRFALYQNAARDK